MIQGDVPGMPRVIFDESNPAVKAPEDLTVPTILQCSNSCVPVACMPRVNPFGDSVASLAESG